MAISKRSAEPDQSAGVSQAKGPDFVSNALRLFMEKLAQRETSQLLDLGPVCGENINFFAQIAHRLYVCDMFVRLQQALKKEEPPGRLWQQLDYPPQTFDGILLWELIDRLEEKEVYGLAERIHELLKPGGMAILFVPSDRTIRSGVNAFVVKNGFEVYLRPQPHLDLPLRPRKNRDVLTTMAPFKPMKSFIYRNGLREFLFQRDAS